MEAVNRVGGDLDGRHEAEGEVGRGEIVVDRLGHGDHRNPHVGETLRDLQAAIAADGDDSVDPEFADVPDDLGGAVFPPVTGRVLERIAAIRCPQERPAFRQNPADELVGQRHARLHQQPLEPQLDTEDFEVVVAGGGADRGPYDSVKAGAVAPAGKDADALNFRHLAKNR